MRINKSLITYIPTTGAGSGTVTSVALSAPTGFSVSGSPIVSSGTLALAFTTGYGIPPLMTGNSGRFLTTNGTTMSWANIAGTDVTGAALTETDDTNVTLTLGGTPSTALLRSVSMTLGWAGQLAVSRGGTGAATLTGVLIGNGTSAVTAVVGGPSQLLRRNSAGTAYEFFTASFLTNPMTLNYDMIYQAAGVPTRLPGPTSTTKQFLTAVGDGTNTTSLAWGTIAATDISAAALTKVDDTNVTLTLGGTPATSLVRAVSLTLGWSGTLSAGRGGTGTSGVSGIMLGNLTAPVTGITGIGGQILRANPSTGVYEFWTPTYLESPFTTSGQIIYSGAGGQPLALNANSTGNNMYLRSVSSGTPAWASIAGGDITGAGITKTDDTNVTLTLGGTPTNSVLRSVSFTLGWTGALSPSRGGTGSTSITGVVIGSGIGTMVGVAGTADQLLRRNSANTAYEFFTPTYLSNPMTSLGDIIYGNAAGAPLRLGANATSTNKFLRSVNGGTPSWEELPASVSGSGTINYLAKWTPSGTALGNSQIYDNGTNVGIGDPAPSVLIDAYKASNGIIRVRADNGGAFYVSNSSKTGTISAFGDAGGIIGSTVNTLALIFSGNVPLAFYVNGSERARFLTTGDFGIGTNAPVSKLDVAGSINMSSASYLTWGGAYGTDIPSITATSGTGSFIDLHPAGSTSGARMRLASTGQLRLHGYTSTSSFSGLTVGLLGFTSTGAITTYSIPGGVSGTQDYLAKFDSTGVAVTDSRFIDNGTNFLLNGASSYITGFNLIGDIGIQSASGQASAIIQRSNQTPTSGTAIAFLDAYAITTGSTYQMGGAIEFRASQNWNSTSAGTNIFVQTAPDNTVAPADMFVFLNNGAVRFIGRTSNPSSPSAGTMYYNSSANNMRYFNGTSWVIF